jgi:hypothetical protein
MLFIEETLLEKTKFISSEIIKIKKCQELFKEYKFYNLYMVINNLDLISELKKSEKERVNKSIEKIIVEIEENFEIIITKNKSKNFFLNYEKKDFENEIINLIELIIKVKYKNNFHRNIDILSRRFGLRSSSIDTLENIGLYYSISRERVRQVSNNILKDISDVLFEDIKYKKSLVLKNELLKLKSFLQSIPYFIPEKVVLNFVKSEYANTLNCDKNFIYFLLNVLGYENIIKQIEYKGKKSNSVWIQRNKVKPERIRKITKAFNIVLDKQNKIEKFKLIGEIKKIIKDRKEDNNLILSLIDACNDYEFFDNYIKKKIEYLSKNEQIYRILSESKEAIHHDKILLEVKKYDCKVNKRYVGSVLSNDERFRNISKSGLWFLPDIHSYEDISIKDGIKKVLSETNSMMHSDDIYKELSKIRNKINKRTILSILYQHDLFLNVKTNYFILSDGKTTKIIKKRNKKIEEEKSEILKFLKEKLTEEHRLSEVIQCVSEKFDYSEQVINTFILNKNKLVRRKDNHKVFISYDDSIIDGDNSSLKDRIQNDIRSILYSNPNIPYQKKWLYNEISKNVNCNLRTFYLYIREMKDIEQWQESPRVYNVMYKFSKNIDLIEISEESIDKIKNEETKTNLRESKEYLSIENIELGIYKLATQFENTIKKFLQLCKEKNIYNITNKDLSKLVNMINCIEREDIVKKGFYLNVLREERNKIMHDITTSKENLFYQAHYFIPLYVNNIILFENKIQEMSLT